VPFAEARGLRFHLQEMGSGTPVVMLHGLFTGSLASWWFTAAPALAGAHRVRLLDLRGHGLSDRPADGYDLATMTDDVLELTADLEPFGVVGHSYGGLIALRLALTKPDRVTRLALIEPPIADRVEVPPRSGGAIPAERALLAETTIIADLEREQPLSDDELAAIAVPMLFAFGSSSWCLPASERVRRVLPSVSCHVLEGGHALHVDARREIAALLVDFLGAPAPALLDGRQVPYG